MLSVLRTAGPLFARESARDRLSIALLAVIPVWFVVIFSSVLGDFSAALGGTLARQSAGALSAGWAAALLSGTLAFFQVTAGRTADRRLALAGRCAAQVAAARLAVCLLAALVASAAALATLALVSGVEHPWHAAAAIYGAAITYVGIGVLIGAVVHGPLEGSLLVVLVFSIDAFSTPQMTSSTGLSWTPTRNASDVLMSAAAGGASTTSAWAQLAGTAVVSVALSAATFAAIARGRA